MKLSLAGICLVFTIVLAPDLRADDATPRPAEGSLVARTLSVLRIHHLSDLRVALKELRRQRGLDDVLKGIASSSSYDLVTRSRALSALLKSPEKVSRTVYLKIFSTTSETPFLRRKALEAMAVRFGVEASVLARQSLSSEDLALREAGIKVIKSNPTTANVVALRRHLLNEGSGYLRRQTRLALAANLAKLPMKASGRPSPTR